MPIYILCNMCCYMQSKTDKFFRSPRMVSKFFLGGRQSKAVHWMNIITGMHPRSCPTNNQGGFATQRLGVLFSAIHCWQWLQIREIPGGFSLWTLDVGHKLALSPAGFESKFVTIRHLETSRTKCGAPQKRYIQPSCTV